MGPSGFLGGGIIGAAVYLVVSNDGLDLSPSPVEDNNKIDEKMNNIEHGLVEEGPILTEENSLR